MSKFRRKKPNLWFDHEADKRWFAVIVKQREQAKNHDWTKDARKLLCQTLDILEARGLCNTTIYRYTRKAYHPWTAFPNTAYHVHEEIE